MSKKIIWIVVIGFGILFLVGLILPLVFGGPGYGMHPYGGMMGRGYMHPFGWAGMGFGWLFMVAILLLIGLGIAGLIKYLSSPRTEPSPRNPTLDTSNCSNCGKPSQREWQICPYCGNKLAES